MVSFAAASIFVAACGESKSDQGLVAAAGTASSGTAGVGGTDATGGSAGTGGFLYPGGSGSQYQPVAGTNGGGVGGAGGAGEVCVGDRTVVNLDDYQLLIDERCSKITGKLSISYVQFGETTPALDTLTTVAGDLEIAATSGLTSLELFPSLEVVGGVFDILANQGLTTLAGLDSLREFGHLNVTKNPVLVDLVGLEGVTVLGYINASIKIVDNPALASLEGLQNLIEVPGVTIDAEAVTSVAGLGGLLHVPGNLYLHVGATSFAGLALQTVGGTLGLSSPNLTSLEGLADLTRVGSLAIANTLDALSAPPVDGSLSIYDNPELTSLAGLPEIPSPAGVTIGNNAKLTTLGPLLSWPADTVVNSIAINSNPKLPQCEVDAFDAAQLNASCNATCSGNDDLASCN